jgi:hypothetical protein
MAFSPDNFWHNASKKLGFAKTSRFSVTIPIPQILTDYDNETTRSLQLQCETAELPGKNLVTQDVKIYGPTYKMATHKQYANEISLSFLCTNTGNERTFFDDWINYINPSLTNNMRYPGGVDGYVNSYLTNITITQFTETFKTFDYDSWENYSRQINQATAGIGVVNTVVLIDSFPIGYAAQQLNWADDGFQRLTVQFAYNGFDNSGTFSTRGSSSEISGDATIGKNLA